MDHKGQPPAPADDTSSHGDGPNSNNSNTRLQLDEETDSLSTLSYSLSLVLQMASTTLYRLSTSTHVQLNPDVPVHVHSQASADGLVPPKQMKEDIAELVDDLMERCRWMKNEIELMPPERTQAEHATTLKALDDELRRANEEYEEALAEAASLKAQVDRLLANSCA